LYTRPEFGFLTLRLTNRNLQTKRRFLPKHLCQ
jgi:hypothetical protein